MPLLADEIYRSGVVRDAAGHEYPLHSHIDAREGAFLSGLITRDTTIHRTLEIGCAYGLSSLHICEALSSRSPRAHTIVDPFQHTTWHGIGVENLRRASFDFFELIQRPSEFALPELAEHKTGGFDLVLIDGVHTFDHTLVDFFYANRLLRVGGYVLFDDCSMPSVSLVVSYAMKYPCYLPIADPNGAFYRRSIQGRAADVTREIIPRWLPDYFLPKKLYDRYWTRTRHASMVALRKVDEDRRGWAWFERF